MIFDDLGPHRRPDGRAAPHVEPGARNGRRYVADRKSVARHAAAVQPVLGDLQVLRPDRGVAGVALEHLGLDGRGRAAVPTDRRGEEQHVAQVGQGYRHFALVVREREHRYVHPGIREQIVFPDVHGVVVARGARRLTSADHRRTAVARHATVRAVRVLGGVPGNVRAGQIMHGNHPEGLVETDHVRIPLGVAGVGAVGHADQHGLPVGRHAQVVNGRRVHRREVAVQRVHRAERHPVGDFVHAEHTRVHHRAAARVRRQRRVPAMRDPSVAHVTIQHEHHSAVVLSAVAHVQRQQRPPVGRQRRICKGTEGPRHDRPWVHVCGLVPHVLLPGRACAEVREPANVVQPLPIHRRPRRVLHGEVVRRGAHVREPGHGHGVRRGERRRAVGHARAQRQGSQVAGRQVGVRVHPQRPGVHERRVVGVVELRQPKLRLLVARRALPQIETQVNLVGRGTHGPRERPADRRRVLQPARFGARLHMLHTRVDRYLIARVGSHRRKQHTHVSV
eukprot:1194161-Prorocentrum_minimum.AAC.9